MIPIDVEDVLTDNSEDVLLKIKIHTEDSSHYISIPIDKYKGMYIADIIVGIDKGNIIFDIYELYLDTMIEKIVRIVINDKTETAEIVLTNNSYIITDIGTAIILGLKSNIPIFINYCKKEQVKIEDLKPTDFEF